MKVLWRMISMSIDYDEESWNPTMMNAVFRHLGKKYYWALFLFEEKASGQMKPYFTLEDMETRKVILRLSEELNHYGPMSDHSDEVSEALWDDCIDWVISHN